MNAPSIAIIGAGPAGLSAAHLLNARGLARVTVFEAGERLGGKSFSAAHAGAVHELGRLRLYDSYHCSRYNTNTGRLSAEMFAAVFDRVRRDLSGS